MTILSSPLISIITVCYNAEKHIENTIQSVAAQTYPHIQYILVDGGSTDHTLEIIGRHGATVTKLIPGPDQGLYDAMNKGMNAADGDYLLFLNADDQLDTPTILEKIFSSCTGADVYYGETIFIDESGVARGLRSVRTPHRLPARLDWKSLQMGMSVSHQAFIIKSILAVPFDTRYQVCADIDWMIRCLKACKLTCNTQLVISRFTEGGMSKKNQRLAWKERYIILARHYGIIPNLINHAGIVLRWLTGPRY